jgi:alginate O-acetyltransferase complex protein AlgI
MTFNSFYFAIFFLIVVGAYYLIAQRYRWVVLLLASCFFYLSWSPKYIPLIIISILTNFVIGIQIGESASKRKQKLFLALGLIFNLGLLIAYKYLNFILGSFGAFLSIFNLPDNIPSLEILLPVGISFYTLQILGYLLDIYNNTQKPEKHLGKFALFVSFFPLLVSGPIERAKRLLPQFSGSNEFDYENAKLGLKRIAWGIFKKIVIADRLAIYVDQVFNHPSEFQGFPLLLAVIFFAFQLYCDFSGYSDIVIGTAKILGIDLMENFHTPFFANSIQNFWNSWHISLSTWLRDYIFFPSRRKLLKQKIFPAWLKQAIPPMVTMLVSGLWHGANWTFVLWGGLHGFYLIAENYLKPMIDRLFEQRQPNPILKKLYFGLQVIVTFSLTCFAWIFFRSNSIAEAFTIIKNIPALNLPYYTAAILSHNWGKLIDPFVFSNGLSKTDMVLSMLLIMFLLLIDTLNNKVDLFTKINRVPLFLRWSLYLLAVFVIVFLSTDVSTKNFIYFKF